MCLHIIDQVDFILERSFLLKLFELATCGNRDVFLSETPSVPRVQRLLGRESVSMLPFPYGLLYISSPARLQGNAFIRATFHESS